MARRDEPGIEVDVCATLLQGAHHPLTGPAGYLGKDPAAPAWAHDKGIKLFQTILKQYGSGIGSRDLKDGYYVAGMGAAYTMVDTLRKAGRNPTRQWNS